jgi:hypothetical protein
MKHVILFLLFFNSVYLFAYIAPQTIYTEERFFITTGELDFHQTMDEVSITLLKYNNYSKWALNGMQGINKESEGLIAYFTDINFSLEESLCLVTFDLNLVWPFGKKGIVMKFKPFQEYYDNGDLKSITLIPLIESDHVEAVEMEFILLKNKNIDGVSMTYTSRIRLSKFLDFFFSLRSYKRNFEWYIFKMADNFSSYLNSQY